MLIQTLVCDKCGEKINANENEEKWYNITCYGTPYTFVRLDICKKCIGDMVTEELLEKKKIQYDIKEKEVPFL